MSAPATALSTAERAELRQTYREAQCRYEGARQMSWLVSGHGHLSPNAKQAMETEIEALRLQAVAAYYTWQRASAAFSAELAARVTAPQGESTLTDAA